MGNVAENIGEIYQYYKLRWDSDLDQQGIAKLGKKLEEMDPEAGKNLYGNMQDLCRSIRRQHIDCLVDISIGCVVIIALVIGCAASAIGGTAAVAVTVPFVCASMFLAAIWQFTCFLLADARRAWKLKGTVAGFFYYNRAIDALTPTLFMTLFSLILLPVVPSALPTILLIIGIPIIFASILRSAVGRKEVPYSTQLKNYAFFKPYAFTLRCFRPKGPKEVGQSEGIELDDPATTATTAATTK